MFHPFSVALSVCLSVCLYLTFVTIFLPIFWQVVKFRPAPANIVKHLVFHFFEDGLSCGIDVAKKLHCANLDNGTFVVKDWLITGRLYRPRGEQYVHNFRDFIENINNAQPEKMRLTPEEWSRLDDVQSEVIAAREKTQDF